MNSHLRIGSKIKQMIYLPSSQVINGKKVNIALGWKIIQFYSKIGIPEGRIFNLGPSSKIQNTNPVMRLISNVFTTFSEAKKVKNVQTFFMGVLV